MTRSVREIERSIIKTYRQDLWVKFIRAVKDFHLVDEGDRIAVAISGGKDSLTMAKLFQELKRHGKQNFELEFICMDPGYAPEIRTQVEEVSQGLGIPVQFHDSDIFAITEEIAAENPCYLCARMRRGNLYARAQALGCNKLALGHHFDDVIETILLNVLFSGNYKTMMPKLKSQNFEGLELIRPLYYIEEQAIIRFLNSTGYAAINCACAHTQKKTEEGKDAGMRAFCKELISQLKEKNKDVGMSIFRSSQNVNVDAILGWIEDGKKHSFLEDYEGEQ